jgi:RNA polymerase sigma factor (sigma-70 family)
VGRAIYCKNFCSPGQPLDLASHLTSQTPLASALLLPFHVTEPDLIAACLRGDPRAQRQLYNQFAGLMLTVCRRYLKRLEDAEEALLLGFAKVFQALPTFRQEGSFEGWIRRIMVNQALMELRRREPLHLSFEDFAQPENLAATPATADTQLQADELLALLQALPTGYRTVFNLYAIEGYSHPEIAEALGITEGTSKSQLSKARAMLQRRLQVVTSS